MTQVTLKEVSKLHGSNHLRGDILFSCCGTDLDRFPSVLNVVWEDKKLFPLKLCILTILQKISSP